VTKCSRCKVAPADYCACEDFFGSLRALGRGEYDHLLKPGMTKGPTDMKFRDAIAAEAMPYGSYVEVGADGYARPDPTLCCAGGVVKRPPGHQNAAEAGEMLKVVTDGPIAAVIDGMTVHLELEEGRIRGGAGSVPRRRNYP
jgi:hypothetical protein